MVVELQKPKYLQFVWTVQSTCRTCYIIFLIWQTNGKYNLAKTLKEQQRQEKYEEKRIDHQSEREWRMVEKIERKNLSWE